MDVICRFPGEDTLRYFAVITAQTELDAAPGLQVHYSDVIMSLVTSQITGVSVVYSILCLGADQRKHQSSASLAFVKEIHR